MGYCTLDIALSCKYNTGQEAGILLGARHVWAHTERGLHCHKLGLACAQETQSSVSALLRCTGDGSTGKNKTDLSLKS